MADGEESLESDDLLLSLDPISIKAKRTAALGLTTRKFREIEELFGDPNNLHLVKTKYDDMQAAIASYKLWHTRYRDSVPTTDTDTRDVAHYNERCKQLAGNIAVVQRWIDDADNSVQDSIQQSAVSPAGSKAGSRASIQSERLKERARLAELQAEQSLLKKRQALRAKEEEFQIELEIAKSKAREQAFAQLEMEYGAEPPFSVRLTKQQAPMSNQPISHSEVNIAPVTSVTMAPVIQTSTPFNAPRVANDLNPNAMPFDPSHSLISHHGEPNAHVTTIPNNHADTPNSVNLTEDVVAAMLLPTPDVPKFKGDPLEYHPFLMAFNARIASRTRSKSDLLYYLDQYLEGQAKELISGCLHMDPNNGYDEALRLLKKDYGEPYKIADAYIKKLQSWVEIKHDDYLGLKTYSAYLKKCESAMRNNGNLSVLDHPPNMQTVMKKLPMYLQNKWRENVSKIRAQGRSQPMFTDIVKFVDTASDTANDPIYGKGVVSIEKHQDKASHSVQSGRQLQHNYRRGKGAKPANSFATSGKSNGFACPCCEQSHMLQDCQSFKRMSLKGRKDFLFKNKLCFSCVNSKDHRSRECTEKLVCDICKRPHPTLLHDPYFKGSDERRAVPRQSTGTTESAGSNVQSPLTPSAPAPTVSSAFAKRKEERVVYHPILPVRVSLHGSDPILTYCLFDNGSNSCFISNELMDMLGSRGNPTTLQLKTMHGTDSINCETLTGLTVFDVNGDNGIQLPKVYSRTEIPMSLAEVPDPQVLQSINHLRPIVNTIPPLMPALPFGLLIGSNCVKALQPLDIIPSDGEGPYAMKLMHGWTVCGPTHIIKGNPVVISNRVVIRESTSAREAVLNLYEQEFLGDKIVSPDDKGLSQEDQLFLEIVDKNTIMKEGHFQIPMPCKRVPNLPDNYQQAYNRLRWQMRKMRTNPAYKEDYIRVMNTNLEKGYAEIAPDLPTTAPWYLPHHGVIHPRKGKLRVVFDCAAQFQEKSLNSLLLKGPDLANSLLGVLTRFRAHAYGVTGDLEAMFSQITVPEEQRDLLRYLWCNPDAFNENTVPTVYRMCVHVFGATSSPSVANYALKRIAELNKADPDVSNSILKNMYIDDYLQSFPSEEIAAEHAIKLRSVFVCAGFNLTKFCSNGANVLSTMPKEYHSPAAEKFEKCMDFSDRDTPIERTLGVLWDIRKDVFGFKFIMKDKPFTRRGVLSTVSSIYDPLGFLAPTILPAKRILQSLCTQDNLDWDDPIPEAYYKDWDKWLRCLSNFKLVQVPRCFHPTTFGDCVKRQLHAFCDGSSVGYGAVVYMQERDILGNISVSFVIGKARLAPIKGTTIPRMELTAAVTAVKLATFIAQELDGHLPITYYTDSMTVLRYITNESLRFKVFVANRVSIIRQFTQPSQWKYVQSQQNPADCASRGVLLNQAEDLDVWLKGPTFLQNGRTDQHEAPGSLQIEDGDPEIKVTSYRATVDEEEHDVLNDIMHRHSRWKRVRSIVALVLKFKDKLKDRIAKRKLVSNELENTVATTVSVQGYTSLLSPDDLQNAENAIFLHVQSRHYQKEIRDLSTKGSVDKRSTLRSLDPYLEDGLLRVGGRLRRAACLDEYGKHPVILPKDSRLAILIADDAHRSNGHMGKESLLNSLRQKYWITGVRLLLKKVLFNCVTCRSYHARPCQQMMADLPEDRLTPDEPPFTRTGMDFFGPFEVKRARSVVKRYGVIFTCLTSRAIHLEMAASLDTDSCINAIRRFIARRGKVKVMMSDNGTNMVSAEKELRLANVFGKEGIEWKFNPPAASHFGGVWESLIKQVRKTLHGLMAEQTVNLNDESLQTLFCEVESILNNRPLTRVSDDANDLQAITPNHLLLSRNTTHVPAGIFDPNDCYSRRRWKQVQYLSDLFWTRWSKEYLHLLQNRHKWISPKRNIEVGDIVLVLESGRSNWKLGKVTETFQDKKNVTRTVKLRVGHSEFVRPIHKLSLVLEASV